MLRTPQDATDLRAAYDANVQLTQLMRGLVRKVCQLHQPWLRELLANEDGIVPGKVEMLGIVHLPRRVWDADNAVVLKALAVEMHCVKHVPKLGLDGRVIELPGRCCGSTTCVNMDSAEFNGGAVRWGLGALEWAALEYAPNPNECLVRITGDDRTPRCPTTGRFLTSGGLTDFWRIIRVGGDWTDEAKHHRTVASIITSENTDRAEFDVDRYFK